METANHMLLPCKSVAAAGAEIGHQKRRFVRVLLLVVLFEQRNFFLQTALAFGQYFRCFQTAEIQLVHHRQNINFKEHRLYHRPFHADAQAVLFVGKHFNKAAFELEQLKIIDKIALDKTHAA